MVDILLDIIVLKSVSTLTSGILMGVLSTYYDDQLYEIAVRYILHHMVTVYIMFSFKVMVQSQMQIYDVN